MSGGEWMNMAPTIKRCPETRAHYAHEFYTPLRANCPGGPEEERTQGRTGRNPAECPRGTRRPPPSQLAQMLRAEGRCRMKTVIYICDGCATELSSSTLDHFTLQTPRQTVETILGPWGVGPRPETHYCSFSCLRSHLDTFAGLEGGVA